MFISQIHVHTLLFCVLIYKTENIKKQQWLLISVTEVFNVN